jgi:hypothetical protein
VNYYGHHDWAVRNQLRDKWNNNHPSYMPRALEQRFEQTKALDSFNRQIVGLAGAKSGQESSHISPLSDNSRHSVVPVYCAASNPTVSSHSFLNMSGTPTTADPVPPQTQTPPPVQSPPVSTEPAPATQAPQTPPQQQPVAAPQAPTQGDGSPPSLLGGKQGDNLGALFIAQADKILREEKSPYMRFFQGKRLLETLNQLYRERNVPIDEILTSDVVKKKEDLQKEMSLLKGEVGNVVKGFTAASKIDSESAGVITGALDAPQDVPAAAAISKFAYATADALYAAQKNMDTLVERDQTQRKESETLKRRLDEVEKESTETKRRLTDAQEQLGKVPAGLLSGAGSLGLKETPAVTPTKEIPAAVAASKTGDSSAELSRAFGSAPAGVQSMLRDLMAHLKTSNAPAGPIRGFGEQDEWKNDVYKSATLR